MALKKKKIFSYQIPIIVFGIMFIITVKIMNGDNYQGHIFSSEEEWTNF